MAELWGEIPREWFKKAKPPRLRWACWPVRLHEKEQEKNKDGRWAWWCWVIKFYAVGEQSNYCELYQEKVVEKCDGKIDFKV